MKAEKATFATVLIAVMFVVIEMMFYLLGLKIIFFAILSALALVGLIFLVAQGIRWFSGDEEQRLDPVEIAQEDAEEEVVGTYTYDQIRAEMGGGDE